MAVPQKRQGREETVLNPRYLTYGTEGYQSPGMSAPSPTRRDFLKTSVLAGAAATLGEFAWRPLSAAERGPNPAPPDWAGRPMRWMQLTLAENDPGSFDPDFWLDYFRRTHSDAVCLSGGGCVAYYPTQVPFHHRSAWLGNTDPLGDLVAGCRRMGMVVLIRTDPHATYDDVKAAHPDWIAVGADGKPRRHPSSPEMWLTCGLGPYNFDFMTAVHREIMAKYRPEGIFINRWDGSGMCYCEHCRENYRAATGRELPRPEVVRGTEAEVFREWREEWLFSLWRTWDEAVQAINPEARIIPNTGGASSPLDMTRTGGRAPTLMADRQARSGVIPPWANGKSAKEFRAVLGNKPVVGIFSVGVEEAYRWKDSVQSPPEIRLWVAEGLANGMRPWLTKFCAVLHDRRWLKPVEEIYDWCHRSEPYLRNERPLARVALVYSQRTLWHYGSGEATRDRVESPSLGWYQALVESRVPFELVHDRLLDAESLAAFKTLILPNIAVLSDAQCAQIEAFAARGGSVIATYETSLYDEHGERRTNFGLANVFAANFRGPGQGPMKNAYLRLEHDTNFGHPLLRGLEDAPRIIHGISRLDVAEREGLPPPVLTLIPPYPDLPMEKVYPRVPRTNIREVYLRETPGGGRVVYFPWDIDRTYWEVLAVDHLALLQNAVAWATNEEPPLVVEGPGLLDVTLWRQRRSVTAHLVNLTNPMMMKGPVRTILPVGPQRVRVRLPQGASANAVRLLVAGTKPDFRQGPGWVEVEVPSIGVHEVVAVDI